MFRPTLRIAVVSKRIVAPLSGIRGAAVDEDFGAEVHEHLRLLTERYVSQSMNHDDAVREAAPYGRHNPM